MKEGASVYLKRWPIHSVDRYIFIFAISSCWGAYELLHSLAGRLLRRPGLNIYITVEILSRAVDKVVHACEPDLDDVDLRKVSQFLQACRVPVDVETVAQDAHSLAFARRA